MSVIGCTWAIWLTLVACTLAPWPQTAVVPSAFPPPPPVESFPREPLQIQPKLPIAPQIQPTIVT